jgi:hypothetical protein
MREYPLAIADLKIAVVTYPAESHQQETARWLLGAVQFWSDSLSDQADALRSWERSLEGFRKLALMADQENRQVDKHWYRDHILYMKGALKGKIAELLPGNAENPARSTPPPSHGMPSVPPSQAHRGQSRQSQRRPASAAQVPSSHMEKSEPNPSTAEPQAPSTGAQPGQSGQGATYHERYQYLCSLVGGDRAVADRLIEHERRLTPDADQKDMVERAIQRLLDDRR